MSDSDTVTVRGREHVGPDTYAVTFESPPDFDGRPGQFVRLSAEVDGDSYARFYTISSPDTAEDFEVTIEVDEEGGPFSAFLADLEPGDDLGFAGPFGEDYYEGEARAVVLAGGPGVGPAVAIAAAAVEADNEAVIVYAHGGNPAHEARLGDLREEGVEVFATQDADSTAFTAAVDQAVTGELDEQLFVYGFADFVEASIEAIEDADGNADGAKIESFG